MNNQSEEISDNTLLLLKELYRGQNKDIAIQNLLLDLIETKIAYYELLNQQMEEKQGMDFQKYQDTQYEEWDGSDVQKLEEFHKWDDAITGIEYYKNIIEQWKLTNLEPN